MSAWIVSKSHIDVLVYALGVRELFVDGLTPDEAGQALWQACHDSVNYRYGEDTPCPAYHYATPRVQWTNEEIALHLGCYDYQTCEIDYYDRPAGRMVTALMEALPRRSKVGDDVPWGVPECGGRHPAWSWSECDDCRQLATTEGAA